MIKTKPLTSKIVLVTADSQQELGRVFLRFQEFYESPEWKDKIFTIGQIRSWYSEKYGANTYEKDWTGFNIPSCALKPFIQGLFDPLTEEEQAFVNLFRYRTDDFYIIGSQEGSGALDHEECHALYYTNPRYRAQVLALLAEHKNVTKELYAWLSENMYHPSVHDDEVHAYMSADIEYIQEKGVGLPGKAQELHKALRALKRKYFK
jgi:hypothetical protein